MIIIIEVPTCSKSLINYFGVMSFGDFFGEHRLVKKIHGLPFLARCDCINRCILSMGKYPNIINIYDLWLVRVDHLILGMVFANHQNKTHKKQTKSLRMQDIPSGKLT